MNPMWATITFKSLISSYSRLQSHVVADVPVHPFLEYEGALNLHRLARGAEHVRPFERPEIGVFGPFQQLIDQLAAFLPVLAVEELVRFGRSGQNAAKVEIGTADEFLIAAYFAGQNIEQLQLGEDVLVDVVVFSRIAPHEPLLRLEIGQTDGHQLHQEPA